MGRWLRIFAAIACAAPPVSALASQVVLTDVTYTHSATTTTDSHYRVQPSAATPPNWRSPIDYASGKAYVRLEVFTKPSTAGTRYQVCFEATPSYACTDQAPTYTAPGVYTWATSFPNFYQYSLVDWTQGTRNLALILKDTNNVKPAPENVGAQVSALYMPTQLRVTVTLVSPGGTYVPPPDSLDAGSPSPDAGPPDAGHPAPDAGPGTANLDAGTPPRDAGTTADAGTPLVADAGREPPTPVGTPGGGCAAAGANPLALMLIGSLATALLATRRRAALRTACRRGRPWSRP